MRWLAELDDAHALTLHLCSAGKVEATGLSSLADLEAFAALDLEPMPTDPVAHLIAGYARTRRYLEHLTGHDPARVMSISARDGYIYPMTPRKILRRVLDHALDHFNQVEQWIDWQDRVMALFIKRVAQLSQHQLEWEPPDDSWTLQRVVHHAARGYGYAAWLDDALPEEAHTRYVEAHRRLRMQVAQLLNTPPPADTAFYGNAGLGRTLADVLLAVSAAEQEIQATGRLMPVSSELDQEISE